MIKAHSRKGMTLVELIIAVAFTAIVIAAACAVLFLGGNFFKSGTASAVNQQKAALAESYIQRYASTAFRLSPTKSADTNGIVFTLSDHVLHVNKQTVEKGTAAEQTVAAVDGIGQVQLQADGNILSYKIFSQDGTYTLSGSAVLNNYKSGNSDADDLTADSNNCLFMELTAPSEDP